MKQNEDKRVKNNSQIHNNNFEKSSYQFKNISILAKSKENQHTNSLTHLSKLVYCSLSTQLV